MKLWQGFKHGVAPDTKRKTVQLTHGDATCYPLYYYIPSFSQDSSTLVYHRVEKGDVQIHTLNLASGKSKQITHADTPATRWIPWCIESGTGVLDHLSVLDVSSDRLIYFNQSDVRLVNLDGSGDRLLFSLPDDRIPIGQNCVTGNGEWFVYIHHDRELFEEMHPKGKWGDRSQSRGTVLAAYHLSTGEHRDLVILNSPIHHVLPLGDDKLVFCHPAAESGMLMTDVRGGWYTHMRTQDDEGGCVCHYVSTSSGLAYEVLNRKDGRVLSGIYNPTTNERYEFTLPPEFGYTHTGRDPEGRLWFFENSNSSGAEEVHDLHFLSRHVPGGHDEWVRLSGHWPTYGGGQKSHFHPQLTPDRKWILMTAGDAETETNHIFLLDIEELNDTCGIPDVGQMASNKALHSDADKPRA